MLNRVAIAISGALLIVVASSCSSGHSTAKAPTPTTAKRRPAATRPAHPTTSRVTPATATTLPPGPALADLILGTAPAGFEQQADNVADTGPTNFAKAADDDVSRDARQALLSSGFEAGYQRQWTSVDALGNTTNQDFVFLYRFATPEGAQAYAQHWRLVLLSTSQNSHIQSFTPPYIPGAIGLSEVDAKQGSTGVVLFAKGQYAVQALVSSASSVDESGAVAEMAFAQYQRLP